MNRIFYHFSSPSFLIPLLFVPFTILLIFSQSTVPGDLLYPYKRGVELIILAAAKLSPTTEAYFRTGLADRRYNEAESLLLAKQDAVALETFLQEIRDTEKSISNVSDMQRKEELKTNLIAKIDTYQNRLTQIETQVVQQQQQSIAVNVQEAQDRDTGQAAIPQIPAQRSIVAQEPIVVTPTQFVQSAPNMPSPTVVVSVPTPAPVNIGVAISNAKDELEKIKEKAKKEKEHEVNNFKKEEDKKDEKSEKKDKQEDSNRGKNSFPAIDKDRN